MKQLKEMPDPTIPSPRFRYWSLPPETILVPVAAIADAIPLPSRLSPFEAGQTVSLPAAEVFGSNIPQIRLARLAELLPNNVRSGEGKIRLPISRLAAIYTLVEQCEEIAEERPQPGPESFAASETSEEVPEAPAFIPPPPVAGIPEPTPEPSAVVPPPPPVVAPIDPPTPVRSTKFPAKRTGLLGGLPMFRRKATVSEPVEDSAAEEPLVLPVIPPRPAIPTARTAPTVRLPEIFEAPADLAPIETPEIEVPPEPTAEIEIPEPVVAEEPEAAPVEVTEPAPVAVRILQTEHMSDRPPTPELSDDEAMQALFLTEEKLTVNRVIELCGDLPGINSCVLAHGSVVIAAHNAPANVDLVSLSAHAEDMLKSMRESSARMGIGTVPAVTLHTEKGVISFFHREDLTMLVFHKDRGFIPGVREKMAAVLGELTKARLTLPAGREG